MQNYVIDFRDTYIEESNLGLGIQIKDSFISEEQVLEAALWTLISHLWAVAVSINVCFTFLLKKKKQQNLLLQAEDLLSVVIYWCFAQLSWEQECLACQKPRAGSLSRVKTKETPGELGSMRLLLLCGKDAAFSGGTKQLPLVAVGVLHWVRLSQREIGSISSKPRTESLELAALPKKTSHKHQPQKAGAAEPQGMEQPELVASWCFITVVLMSHWGDSKWELNI